jgi:hypothetical protein
VDAARDERAESDAADEAVVAMALHTAHADADDAGEELDVLDVATVAAALRRQGSKMVQRAARLAGHLDAGVDMATLGTLTTVATLIRTPGMASAAGTASGTGMADAAGTAGDAAGTARGAAGAASVSSAEEQDMATCTLSFLAFTAEAGHNRQSWGTITQKFAKHRPWTLFEDRRLPECLVGALTGTRCASAASSFECPVASILLAAALRPGTNYKTRQANLAAVRTAASKYCDLWIKGTQGLFVEPGDLLYEVNVHESARLWRDFWGRAVDFVQSGATSAAAQQWLSQTSDVTIRFLVLEQIGVLRCLKRFLIKFARSMYAACTACGRVPFFTQVPEGGDLHFTRPLQFCDGVRAAPPQALRSAQGRGPGPGPGSGPGSGRHGTEQSQGRGKVRCTDAFCDRACQRAHWTAARQRGEACEARAREAPKLEAPKPEALQSEAPKPEGLSSEALSSEALPSEALSSEALGAGARSAEALVTVDGTHLS